MNEAPTPRTIPVNGTELTYTEQGAGEPLIFVHGSLGDFRSWLQDVEPFTASYRTLIYSRRGHFPNPWPDDYVTCDPEIHAADLAALIETLGIGPVHLFGHSYGGLVSLVLASRHPELVRTLVLGEPPLFGWLGADAEGQALLDDFMTEAWEPAGRAFARGDREAGVRVFIDGVMGEGVFDQIPPPVLAMMLDNAAEMAVETRSPREAQFSTLTRDDVQRMTMPALLLDGAESPPIFRHVNDALEAYLPRAARVTIPDTSHDLYNPPVFQEAILGFLAKARQDAADK